MDRYLPLMFIYCKTRKYNYFGYPPKRHSVTKENEYVTSRSSNVTEIPICIRHDI